MSRDHPIATTGRIALALGLASFLAVVATLGDPGITSDEPLDTRVGQRYVDALLRGRPRLDRAGVILLFRDNAQHPPLGRLLVGVASRLGEPFESILGGSDPFSVHPARLAPALAFGILVGLVSLTAGRRFGRPAAIAAGLAIVFMPRLFSHAHFATLDTILTLFWTATVLAVGRAVESRRPIRMSILAGVVWGLALLTKIHAWLLPPLILCWFTWRLGVRRGLLAFMGWLMVGLTLFFGGWPWLWFDTGTRLRGFLATSVERLALKVTYFGTVYLDRDVPWHYPWVLFAVTVPVGLHLLGGIGVWRAFRKRCEDPFPLLLLAAMGLLLLVFSTRAPVYDGERLFLPVFALWAVLIGQGFAVVWEAARRTWPRRFLVLLLLSQSFGLIALHPFGLSYYNLLVGGLPGAARLGLELTYWGDAVDRVLLDDLARRAEPGQAAVLMPTLHAIQPTATLTPDLFDRRIQLRAEDAPSEPADWLIVSRRTAYWPPTLAAELSREPPVAVRSRQGVWLSGLWHNPGRRPRPPGFPASD